MARQSHLFGFGQEEKAEQSQAITSLHMQGDESGDLHSWKAAMYSGSQVDQKRRSENIVGTAKEGV